MVRSGCQQNVLGSLQFGEGSLESLVGYSVVEEHLVSLVDADETQKLRVVQQKGQQLIFEQFRVAENQVRLIVLHRLQNHLLLRVLQCTRIGSPA